jgi:DNA-directed RNA polymerase subunit M/transcription elongation factor TFIIS
MGEKIAVGSGVDKLLVQAVIKIANSREITRYRDRGFGRHERGRAIADSRIVFSLLSIILLIGKSPFQLNLILLPAFLRTPLARPIPFYPGKPSPNPGPLARYLPPLHEGVAAAWLKEHLPPGALVLDPFGAAPRLTLEAARAGYRVLVAANNPVSRILLEMGAFSTDVNEYQAALAELASAYKGGERIEPHIRSLYTTECANCKYPLMADYFLWERSADFPSARCYTCPRCGDSGERPASEKDKDRAATYAKGGLNRARALERVVSPNDPDREHTEEALAVYLPRALYALFTLINKMDTLDISPARRERLSALLLSACDQANTLWAHPTTRDRPRQLSVPTLFRENNVWLAMEQSINQWVSSGPALDVTQWPLIPPRQAGITLYEGRLKDLAREFPALKIEAVLAALPRPNQAFWTLSALWAAWIWGREAVGPFKSVLRRRRYDWGWHTAALSSAFHSLAQVLEAGTPVFGLLGEAEPGFLSAALLAGAEAGFDLEGLALRTESGQAQIHWQQTSGHVHPISKPVKFTRIAREAAVAALKERGQPVNYLSIHAAALAALAEQKAFPGEREVKTQQVPHPRQEESPAELYSRLQNGLKEVFTFRSGFLRFDGSEVSLEVGNWWLLNEEGAALPIYDRVEMAIWRRLQERHTCTLEELDHHLCEVFPGLLTPHIDLIQHCLQSYAEQLPGEGEKWRLRPQDEAGARRDELVTNQKMLFALAERLGYSAARSGGSFRTGPLSDYETVIAWQDPSGKSGYLFHLTSSAAIGRIVLANKPFSRAQEGFQPVIVLPGSRANLISHKLRNDPRLHKEVKGTWTFLKFRHLRRLVENTNLDRENLPEQLEMDPLTYSATQIRLF